MFMRVYTILLLLILAIACNTRKKEEEKPVLPPEPQKEEPIAGGPCTYKDNIYPAKVLKIEGQNDQTLDIVFEVTLSGKKKQTITYSGTMNSYISPDEVMKSGILLDSTYKYVQSEIVTGTCNPKVNKFVFEKYGN